MEQPAEALHFLAVEIGLGAFQVFPELLGQTGQLAVVPVLDVGGGVVLLGDMLVLVFLENLLEPFQVLRAQPFAEPAHRNVLGLDVGHVELGAVVGIGHHRGAHDAGDGHQTAQDDAVGHPLSAKAHLLAVFLSGEDGDEQGPDHGGVLFVVDVAQGGIVAVGAENHLGHVVGADGEAVEFLDVLFGQDGVARDLRHDEHLEPLVAGMQLVHPFEVALHGDGFLHRAHEGQHDVEVLAAEDAPGELERLDLPVVDVAGHAPVAEHGVVLVGLEEIAAEEVAVLVGFEIRGAVEDRLAVEGHGEKPQSLGQGLDVEFLAAAEAAREELLADLAEQGIEVVDLALDANLPGDFLAHGSDLGQGVLDDRLLGHGGDAFVDARLDFVMALDGVGIHGLFLEFVPVAEDDGHMGGEIGRGLEQIQTAGDFLKVAVEPFLQVADATVHGHDLVGAAGAGMVGQGVDLGGKARDQADVAAQLDLDVDEAGGELFAHDLGQTGVEFLDLALDELGQGAVVVGLQGLGMDADVAEHELGPQQAHLEIGDIAQPRKEQGLSHVGQDQPDLGLGGRQLGEIHFAADLDQGQQTAVDAAPRPVDRHVLAVEGAQGFGALDADDGRNAEFPRRDGGVAGIAAGIGENGRGDAHAGHHVRIGAFGGQDVALLNLVEFESGAQEPDHALPGASRGAVALENDLGAGQGLLVHLHAAHEDGVGMAFEFLVPTRLGPGLDEPQTVGLVDAELRVHDAAAVGHADRPHAPGHFLGLGQGQRPAVGFLVGNLDQLGAALLVVVDDLLVLEAHVPDDDFGPVVALEDEQLVRGDHAADHGLAESVAGVDGHEVVAARAPAAGGGVRGEGRAGNDRIDHAHDAHGKRGVLDGPFLLGHLGDGVVAGAFGQGDGIEDGLAAVGHGTQVVGRGAVPLIGPHGLGRADDVEIGVLEAGEGLLAAVLAGGRRTHGHGDVLKAGVAADVVVGVGYGLAHLGRHVHGENGDLDQDGTLAQLVDAFGRGGEALDHIVDEGAQLDGRPRGAGHAGAGDLGQIAHEVLHVLRIAVDFLVVPVDPAVAFVDHFPDQRGVDLGFVEDAVEGHGRHGPELGGAYALDLADQRRVVVLASDEDFRLFAYGDDIGSREDERFRRIDDRAFGFGGRCIVLARFVIGLCLGHSPLLVSSGLGDPARPAGHP